MNVNCQAFTPKGVRCGSVAFCENLCKVHLYSKNVCHGPNRFALLQLGYMQKNEELDLIKKYNEDMMAIESDNAIERNYRHGIFEAEKAKLRAKYDAERVVLNFSHQKHLHENGVDPDAEAQERRYVKRQALVARRQANAARVAQQRQRWQVEFQDDFVDVVLNEEENVPVRRDLLNFVNDAQNVHTTEAVKQTKDIVEKVRKVNVPEEYRWSKETCSKTPGEIIAECNLSMPAAMQMMTQYSYDTDIYDIEEGIYGKVLDSVWQFVKSHADKADLCKILKQEMEDNIGMCAQGNLTRICNIVSGYMEGVVPSESLSERLGRLMPPLTEIEDLEKRKQEATRILMENSVGVADWVVWMDAVMA